MIDTYKDWHKYLPFALCAYCTSICTSTSAIPYLLIYGMEAVLPTEVEIPSLRILSQIELSKAEWAHSCYEQLNMIDEKHMTAMCLVQLYQRRVEWAFNKKVKPRVFKEGDVFLRKRNQAIPNHRGKFVLTYEGPYVAKKAFSRRVLILTDMDGHYFNMPINSDAIIQYFAWRSLSVSFISIFCVENKKKKKHKYIYIYIYKGRSKTWKGGLCKRIAKERERKKMQKVDWKT